MQGYVVSYRDWDGEMKTRISYGKDPTSAIFAFYATFDEGAPVGMIVL